MTEEEKKEIVYLALTDLYHEFNSSINHLLILREFLHDALNIKEGKETVYEFPSVFKYKDKS